MIKQHYKVISGIMFSLLVITVIAIVVFTQTRRYVEMTFRNKIIRGIASQKSVTVDEFTIQKLVGGETVISLNDSIFIVGHGGRNSK